ncbi:MAG: 50S ribosomal protein L24 [Chloroflexi bacterium]|nr:50S ribosomal protein L24 [Chloroflexota bacterium]
MPRRASIHDRATKVPDIRRGDEVLILSGKDAGKRGTVDRVVRDPASFVKTRDSAAAGGGSWRRISPQPARVVVEGLNLSKRHTKPRSSQGRNDRSPRIQQGGIIPIAQPLAVSNVMVVCPACHLPTRVRHTQTANGDSVRVCNRCGEGLAREVKS